MEGLDLLFGFLCFAGPLLLGLIVGRSRELAHIRDLDEREARWRTRFIITNSRQLLAPRSGDPPAAIVNAEVVIASDYLKSFFASWRSFFGGEMRSYQRLLDRARREAVLRLVEAAAAQGYNAIGNIRLEPSDVAGAASGGAAAAMAAVVASATAYHSSVQVTDELRS